MQSQHLAFPQTLTNPPAPSGYPLIQALRLEENPLRHFEVGLLNTAGRALCAPRIYTFDCRHDSIVTLPVYLRHGRLGGEILVEESGSPLEAVRAALCPFDSLSTRAKYRALPHREEYRNKGNSLGGNFFPSVGGSIEWCTLRRMDEPQTLGARQRFIPLVEIISGFESGETIDLRVLLAAFRSARYLGESPSLPSKLSAETFGNDSNGGIQVVAGDSVKKWMNSSPQEDRVAYVTLRESAAPPQPFLSSSRFLIQLDLETPAQEVTLMLRKGIDAVDVAAYTFIGGRPHLLVKREIRPALAVPSLLSGYPEQLLKATSLGGVAESLEGEMTLAQIGERGAQGVREEAGLEPASIPQFLGFSYTSPDSALERAYHFAIEIDPRVKSSFTPDIDEVVDLAYLDIEDVLSLAEEGVIQDPRLELSAHLLKAAFLSYRALR